jgi:DNA-binding CsgD family transcriptional regulator
VPDANCQDVDTDKTPNPDVSKAAALAGNTGRQWLMSRATLNPDDDYWQALASGGVPPGACRRLIYHEDVRTDDRLPSTVREISATKAQIRTTSTWIPDMVISDDQVAVMVGEAGEPEAEPFWIEQPAVVSVLTVIFDQAWEAATPLAANWTKTPSGSNCELLDAELNLLKLLADGATDESVARHLGISLRTTRRYVATLMSRLAATSRFQAGAEAVKRGWLT